MKLAMKTLLVLAFWACCPGANAIVLGGGTQIEQIQCNAVRPGRYFDIFDSRGHISNTWNHVTDSSKAKDFTGLRLPLASYELRKNMASDSSCSAQCIYRGVFVKKYHTWGNTHANGAAVRFDGSEISKVKNLVVELKLNSTNTYLPNLEQIESSFPELTQQQLSALDDGLAHIALVFKNGNSRMSTILTVDQQLYVDRWIRFTIPLETLSYYDEVKYARTYSDYESSKSKSFEHLIIMAATADEKTYQHLTKGKASPNQLFKELDISIRYIGYELK